MPMTSTEQAEGAASCAKTPAEHHPHVVNMPYPGVKTDGDYPYGATICCRCRQVLDGTICGAWVGPHDDYNDPKEEV